MAEGDVIKLLLIEDNPLHAKLVSSYLSESNGARFEMDCVSRLAAGLERLEQFSFDAVLLDLYLPDSYGLDTFRKARRQFPEIPVVVLTSDEVTETAVQAMREGASDFIFKSQMNGPVVSRSVRYAVERSARRRVEKSLEKTNQELEFAREIQQGLFPESPPQLPGLDIAGSSEPATVMGGDFFDYIELADRSLAVAVADAMGHGLGAALLCAETRAALLSLAQVNCDVGEIVTGANHVIGTRGRDTSFVTLFMGRIDVHQRSLTYTSAGHGYGTIVDSRGEIKHELTSVGLPLGVDQHSVYGHCVIDSLVPGDQIVLLTDGIWEAGAMKDDPFGRQRAFDVVREHCQAPAKEMVEALLAAVRQHSAPDPITDDVTAVVVKLVE